MKHNMLILIIIFLILTSHLVIAAQEIVINKDIPVTITITNSTIQVNYTKEDTHFMAINQPHNNNFTQTFVIKNRDALFNITDCQTIELDARLSQVQQMIRQQNCTDARLEQIFRSTLLSERDYFIANFKEEISEPCKVKDELRQQLSECEKNKIKCETEQTGDAKELKSKEAQVRECNDLLGQQNILLYWLLGISVMLVVLVLTRGNILFLLRRRQTGEI